MGGAVAVHVADLSHTLDIIGLVVIDVVEGTAMDALSSMQSFLRNRPKSFSSIEEAISWRFVHFFSAWKQEGMNRSEIN